MPLPNAAPDAELDEAELDGSANTPAPGPPADGTAGIRGLLASGADDVELTVRELTVLDGVARGMINREIAEELFLSVDTVKTHARRLYAKLGVSNRTQAAMRGRWRTDLPSSVAATTAAHDERQFAWGDRTA